MSFFRRYPYTVGTLALVLVTYTLVLMFEFEIAEVIIELLEYPEFIEADEIFLGLVFITIGVSVDLTRRLQRIRTAATVQRERLAVLRSTMRTVLDIVNNFLNTMMLFKVDAERSGALEPDMLSMMDRVISQTAEQLKQLANVQTIIETDIGPGLRTIDIERSSNE
ncbi:MAG: hypothetical protein GFH27_549333n128 [Chloroflexi bacterium AL-W]|nr:hypothetical protein [Chloroflexi bacterium AL-N1]NOK70419.1 hypothetical protein [Chloroflexi bacterium AL-N10]NOK78222.1 hypothetical protein [Chloroflexi bacterium AL-N5]NOK85321.1 hypothetical protein [Chloroflexi bacterium AL-W]NOK92086.1 hypothetical protein [Chloroflexi bacterium AL-N15]